MQITLFQAATRFTPCQRPQRRSPIARAATILLALATPLPGNAQPYLGGNDAGETYYGERDPYDRGDDRWGGHESIVRCESTDQRYRHCRADTDGGVELYRQLSRTACRYHETWGYDRRGIWVDQGCRGDFQLGAGRSGGDGQQQDKDKDNTAAIVGGVVALGVIGALLAEKDKSGDRPEWIVRCESDGGYQYCRADTRNGVRLYRQLSRSSCQYNNTWGYDRRGVWVDNGCRAEFAPN
jgi:hypothetical protein